MLTKYQGSVSFARPNLRYLIFLIASFVGMQHFKNFIGRYHSPCSLEFCWSGRQLFGLKKKAVKNYIILYLQPIFPPTKLRNKTNHAKYTVASFGHISMLLTGVIVSLP